MVMVGKNLLLSSMDVLGHGAEGYDTVSGLRATTLPWPC